MGAWTFDKCCGCIELKTGCFIIGYLSLITYLVATILVAVGMGGGVYVMSTEKDEETKAAGLFITLLAGAALIVLVFMLTFVIVLLVGLHKNKPGHVKAYLIYGVIFFVLSTLHTIGSIIGTKQTAGSIASSIFNILLSFYFLLVIRSQYLVMREPERGPAIYSAANKGPTV